MMQHTSHTRTLMLDWLKELDDRVLPSPSDEEIMERFGFENPEAARTLLADLADRGQITVRGTGVNRAITFGKAKPATIATPTPGRTVKKPAARASVSEDDGISRILDIVRRSKATAQAAPAPAVPSQSAPAAPAVAPVSAEVDDVTPPAPVEAAVPVEPATIEPEITPPAASEEAVVAIPTRVRVRSPGPATRRRQINAKVSEQHYAILNERADAQDLYVSTLVGDMLAEILDGEAPPEPVFKPLIRAHVIRAARDAGIPLEEFVPALIETGLQRFLAADTRAAA